MTSTLPRAATARRCEGVRASAFLVAGDAMLQPQASTGVKFEKCRPQKLYSPAPAQAGKGSCFFLVCVQITPEDAADFTQILTRPDLAPKCRFAGGRCRITLPYRHLDFFKI
jgi:hypothetical protein